MAQQEEFRGELRAAHTMRELRNARRSIPMGGIGVFMRVALAIIFMYMIVVAYSMLGITGPVFVSILFLVAFFVPVLYQVARSYMDQRRVQIEQTRGEQTGVLQDG